MKFIGILRKYSYFITKSIHGVLINILKLDCRTVLTDTVMEAELKQYFYYIRILQHLQ